MGTQVTQILDGGTKMKRWYGFQHHKRYIGKCQTTLAEIKAWFPYSSIEGNLVTIYGPPSKLA
jgi:hypothetical protein